MLRGMCIWLHSVVLWALPLLVPYGNRPIRPLTMTQHAAYHEFLDLFYRCHIVSGLLWGRWVWLLPALDICFLYWLLLLCILLIVKLGHSVRRQYGYHNVFINDDCFWQNFDCNIRSASTSHEFVILLLGKPFSRGRHEYGMLGAADIDLTSHVFVVPAKPGMSWSFLDPSCVAAMRLATAYLTWPLVDISQFASVSLMIHCSRLHLPLFLMIDQLVVSDYRIWQFGANCDQHILREHSQRFWEIG